MALSNKWKLPETQEAEVVVSEPQQTLEAEVVEPVQTTSQK